jgi:hypothetical protein
MKVKEIYEKIKRENPNLVERLLDKGSRENEQQTIYGDLSDWLRDYYTLIPLSDRDVVAKLLIGDYVIHHPYCLQRVYIVRQSNRSSRRKNHENETGSAGTNQNPDAQSKGRRRLLCGKT